MFDVTINPTVNSTAKDYKRSFNVTRSLMIADHESRERFVAVPNGVITPLPGHQPMSPYVLRNNQSDG
jgi:hypothetical protein